MVELEKVIKGLECCMSEKICNGHCPYKGQCDDGGYYYSKAIEDALALLKEWEPVKPIIETHWETPSVYDEDVKVTENKCGACGAEIDKWDKFCRVCGKVVKWE